MQKGPQHKAIWKNTAAHTWLVLAPAGGEALPTPEPLLTGSLTIRAVEVSARSLQVFNFGRANYDCWAKPTAHIGLGHILWFGKTKVVLGLILESVEPIQHQNLYRSQNDMVRGRVVTYWIIHYRIEILLFCLRSCGPEPSSIHHIALPHPAPPDMPHHCKSQYCTNRYRYTK